MSNNLHSKKRLVDEVKLYKTAEIAVKIKLFKLEFSLYFFLFIELISLKNVCVFRVKTLQFLN